jgi:endonuclease/exonuclease/phosphatase family metal-dependent hydrolase
VKSRRANTKRAALIQMLERPSGAAITVICERFGWLRHSARSQLAGLRKEGYEVTGSKNSDGAMVYRITGNR